MLITDFNVDNWGINRDTLGSLSLRSYWDADNRNVIVGAENRVDDAVPLVVQGYYTPEKDRLMSAYIWKKWDWSGRNLCF